MRSCDAHALAHTVANQPLAAWRFNVEARSRIDPHIAVAGRIEGSVAYGAGLLRARCVCQN